MLSSIASYLFGSNTTATTPTSDNTTTPATGIGSGVEDIVDEVNPTKVDVDNLIEVTSLTPSVTGAGSLASGAQAARAIRRGKNRRNNARQQNKRKSKGITNTKSTDGNAKSVTKLSSPSSSPSDSCDEDFDEDEWYIVEKEGKLIRTRFFNL